MRWNDYVFSSSGGGLLSRRWALATLLATESAKAAPVGLATTISAGAGTATVGAGAAASVANGAMLVMSTETATVGARVAAFVAKGVMLVMSTEKLKLAGVGVAAVVIAVVGIMVVKSAHSPKAHTAIVPFQPVVQQSFTKSLWAITFTNGTQVEVLAICDPDAKKQLWWAADGSEALAPNVESLPASKIELRPGEVKRCIIMRVSGPSLGSKDTQFLKELDPAMRAESVSTGDSNGEMIGYTVAVPSGVNSASLKLTMKAGKRRPEEVTLSNLVLMPTGATSDVRILRGATTRPAALTRAGS